MISDLRLPTITKATSKAKGLALRILGTRPFTFSKKHREAATLQNRALS
ncbi:Hypothetical protein Cp3995_2085 [Corynebacterium pseudotuberculosis 3/99-5]|nr:Hypothetical protein Cp3995_2085 [Corynebacterium pseudotuberculosis 3/99-5]